MMSDCENTGNRIGHAGIGISGLRVKMKDVLLAEWTLLVERNKARFKRADLEKISPRIRAALIELPNERMAAESCDEAEPPDQIAELLRIVAETSSELNFASAKSVPPVGRGHRRGRPSTRRPSP
jgi:hypothetical protein